MAQNLKIYQGGTSANTASGARTSLGLAIGTDVLAPTGDGTGLTGILLPNGDGSALTGVLHEITGTDTQVLYFDGDNNPAGDSDFTWSNSNKALAIGSLNPNYAFPEFAIAVGGDFGGLGSPDFLSYNIQNTSSYGSSDYVAAADIDDGSATTGTYGDFGIACSNYQITGDAFDQPLDVYLLSSEGANNLNIAALGIGKRIRFATAGDTVDQLRADIADDRFTIYANKDTEQAPALTDPNWTQAGGWGFGTSPNRLILSSNAGPNTISPTVSLAPTIGVTYRIVITASATSGTISYTFGGESGSVITATTITDFITATTTDNLVITGAASATATITAVSVRALIADTGNLFIEGNLQFGSNIQTTTGADILNSDGAGVATFAQIPVLPASDPTTANQAVRKSYVDAVASGLTPVASCQLATTANITLSGEQTIDGVLTSTSRVLVKNQSTQANNGIYITASGSWTRATDYDSSGEVKQGTFTFISAGSTHAGQQWVQLTASPTLGSSPLVFSLLSATTVYTGSNGVQLIGSDFSAKLSTTGAVTLTGAGSDELTVNVDNSSIERATNALRVKAGGITNAMLATPGATMALDNLAGVAINTSLLLGTSDGGALGSVTKMWSDLFLASGAVINFNAGNYTITHSSGDLAFSGSVTATTGVTGSTLLVSSGGAFTAPSIRTTGDPELGIYFTGTQTLGFSQGGSKMGEFNASGLQLYGGGARVNTFSIDGTLAGNSDVIIPTQKAVKTYADTKQTLNSNLTTLAGLTATTDNFIISVASAWASRTPAQAKTTLGLSTADSPQFTAIELGNASDTTIARVSAGVASIEGATIVVNASSPTLGTLTTTGTIELGNASDTTVARSSAGVISVEGVVIPSISSSDTLTNKRIKPRTSTTTSGDITPALATANVWQRTAQSTTLIVNDASGTPVLGEVLVFMIQDNGTTRSITWNSAFTTRVMGNALPTSTTVGKQLLVTCQYNGTAWLCLSSTEI